MVAYCKELRRLEDKFDGLKLNHIPRCLNEATDSLAKAAFDRELMPTVSSLATNTSPWCATKGRKGPMMARLIQP